jgi:uncharacterized membrane protein
VSAANRSQGRWGIPWAGKHDHGHPAVKAMIDHRTRGERVADDVAKFGGSWPFIFTLLGFIALWMVLNTVLIARVLGGAQFDPYPYIALNLALSAMAGLQAPVIMMSQNRAAARDEVLAAHHYRGSQAMEDLLTSQRILLEENTELTKQVHQLTVEIQRTLGRGAD